MWIEKSEVKLQSNLYNSAAFHWQMRNGSEMKNGKSSSVYVSITNKSLFAFTFFIHSFLSLIYCFEKFFSSYASIHFHILDNIMIINSGVIGGSTSSNNIPEMTIHIARRICRHSRNRKLGSVSCHSLKFIHTFHSHSFSISHNIYHLLLPLPPIALNWMKMEKRKMKNEKIVMLLVMMFVYIFLFLLLLHICMYRQTFTYLLLLLLLCALHDYVYKQ